MANYPNSIKNFLTLNDGVDRIVAAHPNDRAGEITAIETLIGALGSTQSYSASLKNLLIDMNKNVHVEYNAIDSVLLKAGEISIPDASGNVRFRRNTSDLTVDWGDIDIGAEANNTYYVYAMADSAGTGFTAKISLSASLPYGGVFYRKIGSFVNTAGDITASSITNDDNSFGKQFGTWVSRTIGTSYLAATDGFVCVSTTESQNTSIFIYTDSSNPPTTIRIAGRHDGVTGMEGLTCPVKKGDYYKATSIGSTTGNETMFWLPNE